MTNSLPDMIEEAIHDNLAYNLAIQTSNPEDTCKHCGSSTGFAFLRLVGFHKILGEMREGKRDTFTYVGLKAKRIGDKVIVIGKDKQEQTYDLNQKES